MDEAGLRLRIAQLEKQVTELKAQAYHWAGLAAGAAESNNDYRVLEWIEHQPAVRVGNDGGQPCNWLVATPGFRTTGPTFRATVLEAMHRQEGPAR